MELKKIKCPGCGLFMPLNKGPRRKASNFNDCLRRCDHCGISFSNYPKNPTMIYKDFTDNVPNKLLKEGLESTLNNSLNELSRENKKIKFGFSTSEDALTWNFFKYFVLYNRVRELFGLLGIQAEATNSEIYLWGVNIFSEIIETDLYKRFVELSDSLKENYRRRTEPDVMINTNEKLIFIEVKYNSYNEVSTDVKKFEKYLAGVSDADADKIKESRHYELFRNWRIASILSQDRPFEVINLAPKKSFQTKIKKDYNPLKKH